MSEERPETLEEALGADGALEEMIADEVDLEPIDIVEEAPLTPDE